MIPDATSLFIAAAQQGDRGGLHRLVERFTPVLLAQARYRLRNLPGGLEPQDVVQEVWLQALPKVKDLAPRDGRWTPVVLKFLSVILLRSINDHVRKTLRRRGGHVGRGGDEPSQADPVHQLSADVAGVVTVLARAQMTDTVHQALQQLSEEEREAVILRGIEQLPNREAAQLLGVDDSVVTRRFQRGLRHLQQALPESVFIELE